MGEGKCGGNWALIAVNIFRENGDETFRLLWFGIFVKGWIYGRGSGVSSFVIEGLALEHFFR